MVTRYQITCINKSERYNPHERIKKIGGKEGGGWTMFLNEGIAYLEKNPGAFYVSVNGQTVDVIVATHNGNKYLKTRPDAEQPNNLLSLPECP